ncbi:hypothetical protein [Petrimonas sulfuriphila]|uniref:hypothetical protein n=1 Tax=Petrimonas sulfuriphila TaxID=285070 RepID=UPI003EC13DB6
MKTIEEKADLYIKFGWWRTVNGWINRVKEGYIQGYKEATRWRDPKEELPEIGKPIIVKYRTAKDVEKYGIAKYFDLGIGNPWTIEGSTGRNVIGWRPIE